MSLIFVRVSCSKAAALLLDNHIMPTQAQESSQTLHHGVRSKFFTLSGKLGCHVLPNTWNIPPNTARPSNATRQPHLLPVVSLPENLLLSRYITARKSVFVFFCLSFPIDLGTTCDESEWVSFWSRESIVFKLRNVSHEYFPCYVYKRVMYINFISCHGPRICHHHVILKPKGTTCDESEWVSFRSRESTVYLVAYVPSHYKVPSSKFVDICVFNLLKRPRTL